MITISAFADEIATDLKTQMDVGQANGVHCIDVRAIDGLNVSKFTLQQAQSYSRQLRDRGFHVPCIGSPIGKIRTDEDFGPHQELMKHCCALVQEFGAEYLRVFSFYGAPGRDVVQDKYEVLNRLATMVAIAEAADVTLAMENERALFGCKPDRIMEIFETIKTKHMVNCFDPANFVLEDVKPYDEAWLGGLNELTGYFHIKDAIPGHGDVCVPAGTGDGQFRQIFTDLKKRNWGGYMTLEPHLAAGGQFAGFTGPELFGDAARALKGLLDEAGMKYR